MERKIIGQLKSWKENPERKPLILLGARQVGKTWVMKHFGQTEFQNVAYINCDVEPMAKELFAADYNIPRILLTLQAITGTNIEAGKTLIIFDELQEVERGLHRPRFILTMHPPDVAWRSWATRVWLKPPCMEACPAVFTARGFENSCRKTFELLAGKL